MTVLPSSTIRDISSEQFSRDWEKWHADHERNLAASHGFLAITAIHWLDEEPRRYPGAPGKWATGADGVTVDLEVGEKLWVGGEPQQGRYRFGVIAERDSLFAYWEDKAVEVAKRCGHDIIRPRDPGRQLRTAFRGTPSFPPDQKWVVKGKYQPFDSPRPTTVGSVVEGLEHVYDAPGRIDFEIDGRPLSLTAFDGRSPGALSVLFNDETSGITTYAANRALAVDAPGPDGIVVLDFNRSTNLPCAYTDLATCPLPPRENRLPVAVEAGERIPYERQERSHG